MFLYTGIGKDRLDYAQPSGIDPLALFGVNLGLHLIDQVGRLRIHWDGEIPARSRRLAQTARPQGTGGAVLWAGMVNIISAITVGLVAGMTGQFIPLRTAIHLFTRIENKVRNSEEAGLGVRSLPAVDAILEPFLIGKARIACAVLDVGDVRIDLFILADLQAVERVIIGIGGQLPVLKVGFIFSDGDDVFFLRLPPSA